MALSIDLSGKIAFVSGSSGGIGKGCAECLAEAGAHVILNSNCEVEGEETARLLAASGRSVEFLGGDMRRLDDIRIVCRQIEARHGRLDILVNNAGMNLFKGIQDTTPEEYDAVMNLDLRGLFFLTQGAVPLMNKAGGGSVINIASVHASLTVGSIAAYAAAKGGVVALTRSLCQELGPLGIRVNTISPGFTETPMIERWLASLPDPDETMKKVIGYHPIGRIAKPQDIGYAVVFLASVQGSYITGINLTLDGGHTTRLMH